MTETEPNAYRAIEAVWRSEAPRLIGGLTRLVRDVGLAEDFAQDALVAALEHWPRTGIPDRPGAWLMTAAKNRVLDMFRRRALFDRRHAELARDLADQMERSASEDTAGKDDAIGDDILRLMFIACHPILPSDGRVALTLRLLGGLTTAEIARSFLVPEPTIAKRIVRAKRTLAEAAIPFEVPGGAELAGRLSSVLAVLYLIFNEGYAANSGQAWSRPILCEEALRLGRLLAKLAPGEPEAHGLLALMQFQASRLGARSGPDGEGILLLDQDRSLWDHSLIERGSAALELAESLAQARGPYTLQAAIAACHARARMPEETDWMRIVALYDELLVLQPSAVVALNRAVALGMAFGPAVGLELCDQLGAEGTLEQYPQLPSVRADLLAKLGRFEEARQELERAASLTQNEVERSIFYKRIAAIGSLSKEGA
jgi:RNA polymerase sigma factor (sigma-70 family)